MKLSAPFRNLFLFSLLALLATTSCLSNEGLEIASTIQVRYNIPDLNTDFSREGDTLTVFSARLVFQNMQLTQSSGGPKHLQNEEIVAQYSLANNGREVVLLSRELTEGSYSGLNFDLVQPTDPSVSDPEASIVITGQYNNELFKYSTGQSFEKSFDFDEVADIAEFNSSILVQIRPDAFRWFYDSTDDKILDPTSSENRSRINANIIDSFQIDSNVFDSN